MKKLIFLLQFISNSILALKFSLHIDKNLSFCYRMTTILLFVAFTKKIHFKNIYKILFEFNNIANVSLYDNLRFIVQYLFTKKMYCILKLNVISENIHLLKTGKKSVEIVRSAKWTNILTLFFVFVKNILSFKAFFHGLL